MEYQVVFWIVKIVLVIALLGVAAAIATPKGRLPLALRGLEKLMGKRAETRAAGESVSIGKRFFALVLVIIAIIVAIV